MERDWRPDEIAELTLFQFRLLCEGSEKTSERSRYSQMNDEVKHKATELLKRQGSF